MQSIVKGNSALIQTLSKFCPEDGVRETVDQYGNAQHWFTLTSPVLLTAAAAAFKDAKARLSLVTGYSRASQPDAADVPFAAVYHFVLDGVVYNVTALVTRSEPFVLSITAFFANADWHEREMIELVGVRVFNQPGTTRLFLNPELDQGVLNKYVPLSVMMNGACSKDLWEHVLSSRGGR